MKKLILLISFCTVLLSDNLFYNEVLKKWIGVESFPCTKRTDIKIDASKVPKFNIGDYFINNKSECFEITSILDGDARIDYYDGTFSVGHYEGGVIIGWLRTFYKNKRLKSEIFFNNGVKEGKAKEFYEDGILKLEEEYLSNLLNGQRVEYEFNGRPIKVNLYTNGLKNGLERVYNFQGRPIKQLEYRDNIILPTYKTYHYNQDGDFSHILSYKNNRMDGSSLYYDKFGSLIREIIYKDGKIIQTIEHITK